MSERNSTASKRALDDLQESFSQGESVERLELPDGALEDLFPFQLSIDEGGRIRSLGEALRRICPELKVGQLFTEGFEIVRPTLSDLSLESLARHANALVLLDCRRSGLQFRMQVVVDHARLRACFLGSPRLTDAKQFQEMNLSLDDFPPHDSVNDYLASLQAKDVALGEARQMTERLAERKVALRALNERLEAEVRATREAEEERSQIEEALREVQRLEGLGVMAGGIAHEFNNLLVSILGYSDMLQATLEPESEAREHADEILTSAQLAAELCAKLVAYAGRDPVRATKIDLSEFVEQTADGYASRRGVRTSYELHATAEILGDTTQLKHVVDNLLDNAFESVSEDGGGQIVIRTGTAHYDAEDVARLEFQVGLEPGTCSFIEVQDDGVGMDVQTLERLFDPFYSTKFLGRGLGLAIVFGTVSRHRGGIELASRLGEGTRIRVLFRAREGAVNAGLPRPA